MRFDCMIVFLNYRHRDRPQQCDEDFLGSKNWYKSNKLPEIKYIDVGVDVEITTFFYGSDDNVENHNGDDHD